MYQPEPQFLSKSERDSLVASHRLGRDKRICDRIKAILLLDNGWSYDKVAKALLLDNGTIRRYYTIFIEEGKTVLLDLNYSGKASRLSQDQVDQLKLYIEENMPSDSLQVANYVKENFGVEYSISAIISILHKLGFVYKKPKLIPGKADPTAQKEFLNELEKLESELDEIDEVIYMDGVHPQHNSKPAYGWFKKGVEVPLKANSGRERININGALNADSLEVTINIDDAVNAQSTVELFRKLEEKYSNANCIVVICDNARYYRSKIVKEYVKNSRIELKFLPPYAPNLNLIERLWRFMNKKIRNNKYYETFQEFRSTVCNFFETISDYQTELARLLTKNFAVFC
jgi:transposase